MGECQKWVQEHFARWAKSFLETRQQSRWKGITDATNQAHYGRVRVMFQEIRIDTKQAASQKLRALGIISEERRWNEMEFLTHRLKSSKVQHTTINIRFSGENKRTIGRSKVNSLINEIINELNH